MRKSKTLEASSPDVVLDYDVYENDKKRKTKWRRGIAITALAASITGGFAVLGGNNGEATSSEATSTQELELHELPIGEQLQKGVHDIAHRFDGGCEIVGVEDTRATSEALSPDMQDRTTVIVSMKLQRSAEAEEAMAYFEDAPGFGWADPYVAMSSEVDGQIVKGAGTSSQDSGIIQLDEASEFIRQNDGSQLVRFAIYAPEESSLKEKPPITFTVQTSASAGYGKYVDGSEVVCGGTALFRNGTWQLG